MLKPHTWLCLSLLIPLPMAGFAQVCLDGVAPSTPTSQFGLHEDGTVTDTRTGLMWSVCNQGESWNNRSQTCEGEASLYSWNTAVNQVQTFNNGGGLAGYTDWRLPDVKELRSLLETRCVPSVNLEVFPTTNGHYRNYLSSSLAYDNNLVWTVGFTDLPTNAINDEIGDVWDRKDTRVNKDGSLYLVRLVRD